MNNYSIFTLKAAKKIYSIFSKADEAPQLDVSGIQANETIKSKILGDQPLMVARFGANELNTLANYIAVKFHKNEKLNYIKGNIHHYWWDKNTMINMSDVAGFNPANQYTLEKFSELMFDDIRCLDILGSWLSKEKLFSSDLSNVIKIGLEDLEPYRHDDPWTLALENKKVLVVHPFEESIKAQYLKKDLLFNGKKVLPDFDLITLKAIQSVANNQTEFRTWFEALDYMKKRISEIDFDVAIIGCGAYGFPLAAHVKRMGKKSIHLGGATQILFGIMGKRWEREKKYEFLMNFKNQHWTRPMANETPQNIKKVENACYW